MINVLTKRHLEIILDTAPVGMLLVDGDFVIKMANNSVLNIFGRKKQEIINQNIGNGLSCINSLKDENSCGPDCMNCNCELKKALVEIRNSKEAMSDIEINNTVLSNDTEKDICLSINSVPIILDDEEYVILAISDISKYRQVKRDIEKSRDFYLTLFENFPALIWRSGIEGKCDYFNKSWLNFTGRTLEQELGDGWTQGVHPDDRERCFNTYLKAFKNYEEFDMEYRLRRFDGEYRWIIDMGRPFYNLEQKFSGYIGTCYDITERKTAEEGLKRYQLLSECANDIIIFSDINGRIIEANSAALMSYGYTKEEILSKSIFDLVNPDVRTPVRSQSHKTDADGVYYEATAKRKDGSVFFVEAGLQSAEIGDGKSLLSIQRDITERKQVQKELERAMEYAEAASLAKSEFLANMSHEIRTPLNGMLGMIDLTFLTGLTEEQKDNLSIAKECASTLLNLINDILDFSRIEARKLKLESISFDFIELIEQTIKPHSIKAQGKGLKLIYQIDPQVARFVIGDPNRLKQVINNILGNAVKFTDEGEVNFLVNVKESTADNINVEFKISDTGIGIGSKEIGRLFRTFSQTDSSITRKYGGSGLGLAISRQLIELMKGTIRVESEKGIGSTFYFTVKLGVGRAISSIKHKATIVRKTQKPLKILLAEDDKINQFVITRMLMEAGHNVEYVNNGVEALEHINKVKFDVVLMDIQMPEMNGIDVVKKVRKSEKDTGRHTPIIALTAYALQGDKEKYLSIGMDDYISKPVQIDRLLEIVEKTAKSTKMEVCNLNDNDLKHKDILQEQSMNVEKIINKMSSCIVQLQDALTKEDLMQIGKYAHEIKQLSSIISAIDVKRAIFKVELAARREDLLSVMEGFDHVIAEFEKLSNYT